MKKRNYSFMSIMATVLISTSFMVSSCTKGNDYDVNQDEYNSPADNQIGEQVIGTLNSLNQELSVLDTRSLVPLRDAVIKAEGDEDQEFNAWLNRFLTQFIGSFQDRISLAGPKAIVKVVNLLKTGWNGPYDKYAERVFTRSFIAQDSSVYDVTVKRVLVSKEELETDTDKLYHSVIINKDDSLLLALDAMRNYDHPFQVVIPWMELEYTGVIEYNGIVIDLLYNRETTHFRQVGLDVYKAEEESPLVRMSFDVIDNVTIPNIIRHDVELELGYMFSLMQDQILVSGNVKELGATIANVPLIVAAGRNGTTQENCNTIATTFNELVDINLTLVETEVGKIIMITEYSEELEAYVPSLVVDSPLLGDEPLSLSALLDSFGIDIKDIFSIFGDSEETDE